jgi:hypothetical protein
MATELLGDVRRLDDQIKALDKRITAAVVASGDRTASEHASAS